MHHLCTKLGQQEHTEWLNRFARAVEFTFPWTHTKLQHYLKILQGLFTQAMILTVKSIKQVHMKKV